MKFKKISSILLTAAMAVSLVSCGSAGQKDSAEFSPALSTDTSCSIRVVGSYSNFESLESEFERFYEYYPNVSMNYV